MSCRRNVMLLALKKCHSPFLKFSYVYLTMQRPAVKFDPTPLMRPTAVDTVKFLLPDNGRINEVPLYLHSPFLQTMQSIL